MLPAIVFWKSVWTSQVVPLPRAPVWCQDVRCGSRHVGSGMHLGRVTTAGTQTSLVQKLLICLFFFFFPKICLRICLSLDSVPCRRFRSRPADEDLWGSRDSHRRDVARMGFFFSCFIFYSFVSARTNCHFYQMFLQGVSSLPDYVSFKIFPGTPLEHIFSAAGDDLLELLQGLFTFNPLCRTTATQVLLKQSALIHILDYTMLILIFKCNFSSAILEIHCLTPKTPNK